MKRILIIGNWGTTHVRRFLTVLSQSVKSDQDLIIDTFDPGFAKIQYEIGTTGTDYKFAKDGFIEKLYSIRKFGTYLADRARVSMVNDILMKNKYDLVNIHFLPVCAVEYVRVAHRYGVKTLLTPLGSDVLRLSDYFVPRVKSAFQETDYVSFNTITGFCNVVSEKYGIKKDKIVNLGYGSEVLTHMIGMGESYTKQELSLKAGIPFSNYNIVCGYTASVAQRHDVMLRAIKDNKNQLPSDYQIVIPLSYGPDKVQLQTKLSKMCEEFGLRYYVIDRFLSDEEMAAFRKITDLFIHIQPTDAYNVSLQESLFGGSTIINGQWLSYPSLERFGSPFIICESLETLSENIKYLLSNNVRGNNMHSDVKTEISSNAWSHKIIGWVNFYKSL